MPLRRVPAGSNQGFSWANKHSGSVLDLTPGTGYEIELTLTDPDGGSETRTVTVSTRPVPLASPTGTVKPVTPATFSQVAGSADPGDILVLAAGDYSGFVFGRDGTESEPIVIRSDPPKAAVINGEVRLDGRSYVYVEGLTVNEKIKFNNAVGIVVRGCTINTPSHGIVSYVDGVTNGYFADNIILGPTTWSNASVGAGGDNLGEGIEVTGPGNVIEHNYVKGFRDAISTMEDSGASNQVSVDILNNDIEIGADDGIEADFTMGNSRVMRNRITNSFVGLSSQPWPGRARLLHPQRDVQHHLLAVQTAPGERRRRGLPQHGGQVRRCAGGVYRRHLVVGVVPQQPVHRRRRRRRLRRLFQRHRKGGPDVGGRRNLPFRLRRLRFDRHRDFPGPHRRQLSRACRKCNPTPPRSTRSR